MKIEAKSPEEYIKNVPDDRTAPMSKLRKTILDNLVQNLKKINGIDKVTRA